MGIHMVSLRTHLNNLDFARQLVLVEQLLNQPEPMEQKREPHVQAKVTFWGSRVVKVKGYTGTVSIDFLAKKIYQAGRKRCNADNMTIEERLAGLETTKKIKNFYKITDDEKKNSNFFTRFLVWIREFTFNPYTTRFYLEDDAELQFRGFNREKFIQHFGNFFDDRDNHPAADGFFGPPQRILARENILRQYANDPAVPA